MNEAPAPAQFSAAYWENRATKLLGQLEAAIAENERLRAVLQRADSRLSLLRYRGGIKWGALGIGDASEVDEVIGEARRLLAPPGARHGT